MNQWLQKQIQTGFADFKGLSVTARIPLRDALVNELIAEALSKAETKSQGGGVDLRPFVRFVKKAEVHASEGVVAVDVVVAIE